MSERLVLAESKLSVEEAAHGKVTEEVVIIVCFAVSNTIIVHSAFYQPITS